MAGPQAPGQVPRGTAHNPRRWLADRVFLSRSGGATGRARRRDCGFAPGLPAGGVCPVRAGGAGAAAPSVHARGQSTGGDADAGLERIQSQPYALADYGRDPQRDSPAAQGTRAVADFDVAGFSGPLRDGATELFMNGNVCKFRGPIRLTNKLVL